MAQRRMQPHTFRASRRCLVCRPAMLASRGERAMLPAPCRAAHGSAADRAGAGVALAGGWRRSPHVMHRSPGTRLSPVCQAGTSVRASSSVCHGPGLGRAWLPRMRRSRARARCSLVNPRWAWSRLRCRAAAQCWGCLLARAWCARAVRGKPRRAHLSLRCRVALRRVRHARLRARRRRRCCLHPGASVRRPWLLGVCVCLWGMGPGAAAR